MNTSTPATAFSRNRISFTFEAHPIRIIVDKQGDPWFRASDVCAVLGYAKPQQALAAHVNQGDQTEHEVTEDPGICQKINHLNESGLNALIVSSSKKKAQRFKQWICLKVMPDLGMIKLFATFRDSASTRNHDHALREIFHALATLMHHLSNNLSLPSGR
ncbi:MAG: Bro-N domain-containing protein [Magnetococcus sp. YQC-5]